MVMGSPCFTPLRNYTSSREPLCVIYLWLTLYRNWLWKFCVEMCTATCTLRTTFICISQLTRVSLQTHCPLNLRIPYDHSNHGHITIVHKIYLHIFYIVL
jgi:hypothetical protein